MRSTRHDVWPAIFVTMAMTGFVAAIGLALT
jgi:hypothetical protein